jgi:hypothetical protein
VKSLLQAEKGRDRQSSYNLLSAGARDEFTSLADWARRRDQLPTPLDFEVKAGKDAATAVATVTYAPSLDPFKGLVTSKEIETWTGVKVSGGWLLDGDPDVELVLPDVAGAVDVAKAWAQAVEACDQGAGHKLEGVSILFGTSTQAAKLCGSKGAVEVGGPGPLGTGTASTDIVSQYSSDALTWTRVVPVTAPVRFDVILAPIGSDWRVIGIADAP